MRQSKRNRIVFIVIVISIIVAIGIIGLCNDTKRL